MMSTDSTYAAPVPARSLPAWTFSILFHSSAVAILLLAIQPWPRSGDANSHSIGIVLNHSSADGDLNGDEQPHSKPPGVADDPEPPALLTPPQVAAATAEIPRTSQPETSLVKLAVAPMPAKEPGHPTKVQSSSGGTGRGALGASGGTGYAKVSVFGVEGKGSKFVYLFDRSASMEGAQLAAAKRQLLESMKSLDSIHQFHIIFFNTKTHAFDLSGGGRRIAFATDRNKQLASNFVGGVTADGGTDRVVALREALAYAPDVIFFLTDADDPMSDSELKDIARLNRRSQAAICVIEFGRQPTAPARNFLMQLATDSGGQYGYVDTTKLPKVASP